MPRSVNFQTISWFWDLYQRKLLELNPPYQRRSVWNREYQEYFIDTILHGYPSPAVFLYQEIAPEGTSTYSVVDGKQRLSTLIQFAEGEFAVADDATIQRLRGKYFKDFDADTKTSFWSYQISVEYLPSTEENIINDVFDRINRNVAKLTPQELRHARFDGAFIKMAEELSEHLPATLPANFPLIVDRSRKQMKDVEFVAQLLLLIEEGPKSYSIDDLDKAFSERDASWEQKEEVVGRFRQTLDYLKEITNFPHGGQQLSRTRLRNQADFYSLFGAIEELYHETHNISVETAVSRLVAFVQMVDSPEERAENDSAATYYEAARSASNDGGPRRKRIDTIKRVLMGGDSKR